MRLESAAGSPIRTRVRCAAWLLAAAVLLPGCHKTPTGPSGPPAIQNFSGTVAPSAIVSQIVTSDRPGVATATLTWADPKADLDFYVTAADCAPTPFSCANLAFSQAPSGTSEQIVFGIMPAQPVRLWIEDLSNGTQTYSIKVSVQ